MMDTKVPDEIGLTRRATLVRLGVLAAALPLLAACNGESEVEDAAEDAADAVGDAAEDAGDAVEDATQ